MHFSLRCEHFHRVLNSKFLFVFLFVLVFFLCVFLATDTPKSVATQKGDSSQFSLIFSEDFNNGNLGSRGWILYNGPFASSQNACFTSNNIKVSNGKLILRIDESSNDCGRKYSIAGVTAPLSTTKQTYGKWEVVMKFPAGKGTGGYTGLFADVWPPEIDFAEQHASEPTKMYLTQHYDTDNKMLSKVVTGSSWMTAFHTYTLEWVAGKLRYYIDGQLELTQTQNFTSIPMFHALGAGVSECGSSWGGCPSDFGTSLPRQMEIESVKIWKYGKP